AVLVLLGAAGVRRAAQREPESEPPASGRFLVAADQVRASFFQHSVVLLLSYAADGSIGLVVNRRTDVPLHDFVKGAALGAGDVYLGGPVDPGTVLVLLRSQATPERSIRIADDLFDTVDPATLLNRAGSPDAARLVRVYTGYAGWGPGQLDAEIARGDWIVAREGVE